MIICTITTEDGKHFSAKAETMASAHAVAEANMNAAAWRYSQAAMARGKDPVGLFEKQASYVREPRSK